jgi:hypothetical protein
MSGVAGHHQVAGGIPVHATNENSPPPRSLSEKILLRRWEYRYPRLLWGLRFSGGVVLLGVSFIILAYGSWWGLLPLAGAAGAFFGGYRIYQVAQRRPVV